MQIWNTEIFKTGAMVIFNNGTIVEVWTPGTTDVRRFVTYDNGTTFEEVEGWATIEPMSPEYMIERAKERREEEEREIELEF